MSIRSDITMDWASSPRIFTVDAPSVTLDVQDFIDTCSSIESQPSGMDEDSLLETSGKEFLTADGSVKVGLTVTMNNLRIAFEARPGPDWVLCDISGGNVVSVVDVFANPRVYTDVRQPTAFTSVDKTSSSSATLSEQAAVQYSSYNGGVTIDVTSANAGTDYPIGTPQAPVNNLDDAHDIAVDRGFPTFYIIGDLDITAAVPAMSYHTFIGQGKDRTTISIDPIANVLDCTYYDAHITGTLDGNSTLKDCYIDNLNYIKGFIERCVLSVGTIVLGGSETAHFLDCWSGVPGTGTPTIDMGGAGQPLALRNYNGGIKLINKSGTDSVSVDLNSGQVKLGADITNGDIVLRGVGTLTEDLSSGATIINQLVNVDSISEGVWTHTTATDLVNKTIRILGLTHENFRWYNQIYDGNNNLTSGSIKLYPSKVDLDADINSIEEYVVTATYDGGGLLDSYKVGKL